MYCDHILYDVHVFFSLAYSSMSPAIIGSIYVEMNILLLKMTVKTSTYYYIQLKHHVLHVGAVYLISVDRTQEQLHVHVGLIEINMYVLTGHLNPGSVRGFIYFTPYLCIIFTFLFRYQYHQDSTIFNGNCKTCF